MLTSSNAGEDAEHLECKHGAGRTAKWCSHFRKWPVRFCKTKQVDILGSCNLYMDISFKKWAYVMEKLAQECLQKLY